jgi:hypothetical protein
MVMGTRLIFLRRLAIVAVLGVAFVLMASIFDPGAIRASQPDTRSPGASRQPELNSIDPHEGLRMLGTLHHHRYTVRMFAGAQAPLYSVYDRDGSLLATLRTAAQIQQQFPSLPLPSLDADTPLNGRPQIMKVDPDDDWP